MKSCLLSLIILAVCCHFSLAQCSYSFSVSQDAYIPLTVNQSLNDTNVWDDINYKKDIGFSCELDWTKITKFALVNNTKGEFIGVDTTSLFNGFCILDADLEDRGKLGDTISKSSIRYVVDIVNGKKILKIEYYNAGFWRERDIYGTMDDSVNLQVWLYEGSNVIELRYGSSKISHPSDYFVYGTGTGPVIGFVKDAGLFSLNLSTLYYLRGNPASPSFDSCNGSIDNVITALDSFPAEGTVYRFSPLPNSIKELNQLSGIQVHNTICTNDISVTLTDNPVEYEITSITGCYVNNRGYINKGKHSIDVSNLPGGTYVLKLVSGHSFKAVRFIKI